MDENIEAKLIKPQKDLPDYIDSFWMLQYHAGESKEIVVLPDGKIDLFFSYSKHEAFHTSLMGLSNEPDKTVFQPKTKIFAVSFTLLAVEYLFKESIALIINKAKIIEDKFWNITENDMNDFESFVDKVSIIIKQKANAKIDNRKQTLFNLIYASNGSMSVKELAEKSYWSSRQINRYFHQQFGMSLKAYCNILRFRASFQHIKEGKLFPEQNFSDQPHFIKAIKKLAGVKPKDLFKNQNDRFIHFSTLTEK